MDFEINTKVRTFPHVRGLIWACQQEKDNFVQCQEILICLSFSLKRTQTFVSIGDAGVIRDARKKAKKALFGGSSGAESKYYAPASKIAKKMISDHDGLVKLGLFLEEAGCNIFCGLHLQPY